MGTNNATGVAILFHKLSPPNFPNTACRGMDPDLFHPTEGQDVSVHRITLAAKAVCHGCPVEVPCLAFALEAHEDHGIWGGTSERERTRLRRHPPGAQKEWIKVAREYHGRHA